mmetsp:Transcript_16996/g.47063  ORF Transcript_16996/g.47063 Transcript_16996/m.47063 type:complete len:356 (-) Transcript_16996:665-1732(-)
MQHCRSLLPLLCRTPTALPAPPISQPPHQPSLPLLLTLMSTTQPVRSRGETRTAQQQHGMQLHPPCCLLRSWPPHQHLRQPPQLSLLHPRLHHSQTAAPLQSRAARCPPQLLLLRPRLRRSQTAALKQSRTTPCRVKAGCGCACHSRTMARTLGAAAVTAKAAPTAQPQETSAAAAAWLPASRPPLLLKMLCLTRMPTELVLPRLGCRNAMPLLPGRPSTHPSSSTAQEEALPTRSRTFRPMERRCLSGMQLQTWRRCKQRLGKGPLCRDVTIYNNGSSLIWKPSRVTANLLPVADLWESVMCRRPCLDHQGKGMARTVWLSSCGMAQGCRTSCALSMSPWMMTVTLRTSRWRCT